MASNGPSADLTERIAAAKRQADTLKEEIRIKKERLADTTRECARSSTPSS